MRDKPTSAQTPLVPAARQSSRADALVRLVIVMATIAAVYGAQPPEAMATQPAPDQPAARAGGAQTRPGPAAHLATESARVPMLTLSPQQVRPTCVVDAEVTARQYVLLGEPFAVTVAPTASCAGAARGEHIVLVLDGSSSTAGSPTGDLQQAVIDSVRTLRLNEHPARKVGVVRFSSEAQTLCQLTNDVRRVEACIRRVGGTGGARFDLGLAEGLKTLLLGRQVAHENLAEFMVLVTQAQAPNPAVCSSALDEARRASSQSIQVSAMCIGPNCDSNCVRPIAMPVSLFYEVPNPGALPKALPALAQNILGVRFAATDLTIRLSAGFEIVPNSASPPADTVTSNTIAWGRGIGGAQRSFEVRATEPGPQHLFESGTLTAVDILGFTHVEQLDSPLVSVFGAAPVP